MDSVSKVSLFDHLSAPQTFHDPRLSIVVPLGGDPLAFENTLISVLESRPDGCELIVAHDGSYQDPFQLCDEVMFAVAPSSNFADLVQAGARVANARFVHVLSPGLHVELGWVDAGLEKFEHADCGSVACVIRDPNNQRLVSAGWDRTASSHASDVCAGEREVTPSTTRLVGAHLQASFWRRDLLRSLSDCFEASESRIEASVAYEYLSQQAGWRCVVAEDCELIAEVPQRVIEARGFRTTKRLAALQSHFSTNSSILPAVVRAISSVTNPAKWSEALGGIMGALASGETAARISEDAVFVFQDDESVIKLPSRQQDASSRQDFPERRAA